jgi:hypothetical protein
MFDAMLSGSPLAPNCKFHIQDQQNLLLDFVYAKPHKHANLEAMTS